MHDDSRNTADTYRPEPETDENEIDLLELATRLWNRRRTIIRWCGIGVILALIVAFSIPKEYNASVTLAPEIDSDGKTSGGLGALASMAGISAGSGSTDAVYPDLYPDVVRSVPFATSLLDVVVPLKEDSVRMTVKEFLLEETSSPWWSVILGVPGKIIGLFKSNEPVDPNHKLDNFQLTKQESDLVEALNARVFATVDSKTSVITINVLMQDPLVSAVLADTVTSRLQEFITAYRTNKARQDLKYIEQLNDEAKDNYYKVQQTYADYLDRNQGITLHSAQITRDRLQNEAQLAFSLYNQTSQQVQKARAKVQETTPIFAIVSPATVPIRAAKPRKVMILAGFVFLSFVAASAWILFGESLVEELRNKRGAKPGPEAEVKTGGSEDSTK